MRYFYICPETHRGVVLFADEVVETLKSIQGPVIWCKGGHFLGLLVRSLSAEPQILVDVS